MRGTNILLATMALSALVLIGVTSTGSTTATFTATTTNPGNTFATATLVISNDKPNAGDLVNITRLVPGDTGATGRPDHERREHRLHLRRRDQRDREHPALDRHDIRAPGLGLPPQQLHAITSAAGEAIDTARTPSLTGVLFYLLADTLARVRAAD